MLTLGEIKIKTSQIFENRHCEENNVGLVVPSPGPDWQRKLEALENTNLKNQRNAAIFDMRCQQAEKLGFIKIHSSNLISLLMGEDHTDEKTREDLPRQEHEWMYNHHTDITLDGKECNWGGYPVDFFRMERKSLWYIPPFSKVEKWRVRFGKLDYLKRTIPYGVVLRMMEVKELNLFNAFSVAAPIEAWERKTDIDPIVVASIWEITKNEKGTNLTAGQVAHYFLAQW